MLAKRLKTLADKISHDVMVPLGKLAYVPGRLKHTNEILVLLGENWFAECSAKQSGEIIKRRVASRFIFHELLFLAIFKFRFLFQNVKKQSNNSKQRLNLTRTGRSRPSSTTRI